MTTTGANYLEISGLSVSLASRQVIPDLSCGLESGSFAGLIGPNGSGKSTLLKAVMGLLSSTGSVMLEGDDLLAKAPRERAKLVAYLPQDGQVVWPIAVEDLVMLGRGPHRTGFAPPPTPTGRPSRTLSPPWIWKI